MSALTLQALNMAIGSIAFEREMLLMRIGSVPPTVADEEQLADQVLLLEQTLGEFRDVYQSKRSNLDKHPPYAAIVAEGVRSAREAFAR